MLGLCGNYFRTPSGQLAILEVWQPIWKNYAASLEFYLAANGVTKPERKHAVLLSVCTVHTFDLAQVLLASAKLADMSYGDILTALGEHFSSQSSEIAHHSAFYKCNQSLTESVSTCIAELQQLTQHCGFPNLEENLCDHLICGLHDEAS